ncbi:hypothetical protein CYY_002519 [Polysphondylium violaceum]|uniref:Uncharacterized protein n=1 Tax=Polysphondylium violaceum TaxID=133409 RepID=A0A8J4Q7T3_9MYCE|nr:hypothetical protein CYY_002519 [Polysphondylium violaceum]
MSKCPFHHISSATTTSTTTTTSTSITTSNQAGTTTTEADFSTLWGCQVIRDGGLNFNIKTNQFLKCTYLSKVSKEEEEEENRVSVCPFLRNESASKSSSIHCNKNTIEEEEEEDDDDDNQDNYIMDKDGCLIMPMTNIPHFLTFEEIKYILESCKIQFKDQTKKWNHLHFYKGIDINQLSQLESNTMLGDIIPTLLESESIYIK